MKLYEFNSYSVGDFLIFEMHEALKSKNLLENDQNTKEFIDFINFEKSHTELHDNLIVSQKYFPIGIQGAPAGELIILKYSVSPAEYINKKNGKIYFTINNSIVDFPQTRKIGDGILETLIYNSINDRDHALSVLTLKFSGWDIKVHKIK